MIVAKAPGLHLQGRESAPFLRVPTAVAGFVGLAERGPLDVAQPLRGWGEYLEVFGSFVDHGYLAETVFAFFLGGGEKCWVVRVADSVGPAIVELPGQCPRIDPLAAAANAEPVLDRDADESLRITAIDEG